MPEPVGSLRIKVGRYELSISENVGQAFVAIGSCGGGHAMLLSTSDCRVVAELLTDIADRAEPQADAA